MRPNVRLIGLKHRDDGQQETDAAVAAILTQKGGRFNKISAGNLNCTVATGVDRRPAVMTDMPAPKGLTPMYSAPSVNGPSLRRWQRGTASSNVRIPTQIPGHFARSRRLRPDSPKTYGNLARGITCRKTHGFPGIARASLIGPLMANGVSGKTVEITREHRCDDQIHLPQLAKLNFTARSTQGEARRAFSQSSRANVSSKSLNEAAQWRSAAAGSNTGRSGTAKP